MLDTQMAASLCFSVYSANGEAVGYRGGPGVGDGNLGDDQLASRGHVSDLHPRLLPRIQGRSAPREQDRACEKNTFSCL